MIHVYTTLDKIVTGSYSGLLRIYYPRQNEYKIDDLMLEKNLEEPILQIAAGRFSTVSSSRLSLAVLHPRRLVVYNVIAKEDGKGNASYYEISRAYDHRLDRTAFNFCYGPFGQAGKDFICVQSMDGQLQFFEHDAFAFSRYLNNFLVPGPICYVDDLDSFLTVNASMELECYKYQVLSSSSSGKSDEKDEHGLTASKKVQTDWSLNLGEHAVEIKVGRFTSGLAAGEKEILVLGEFTLFVIHHNGSIRMQKRLDYNPSCMHLYKVRDNSPSSDNLMIGTYQDSLSIYKDAQLVWAARTHSSAVGLAVGSFGGIKGFVVTLNDNCRVTVCYMGTDPPLQGANGSDTKELDYEAMDEEHRRLLKMIKQVRPTHDTHVHVLCCAPPYSILRSYCY